MSYILDALRRADAERARGTVPDLHAQPMVFAAAPAGPSRRRWLAGTAVAIALLVLGAAAWVLFGGRDAPTAPVAVAPPSSVPVATPSAPETAIAVMPPPVVPSAPAAATPPALQPPATPVAAAAPHAPTAAPAPPRKAAATHVVAKAASAPIPAAGSASEPTRVWRVAELPDEVRRDFPGLRIGGSIGSPDPASRMLIVDGQLLHEGDEAAPGLRIREIRLRSALVEFRGYRIEVGY